jgi:hypothetical protein
MMDYNRNNKQYIGNLTSVQLVKVKTPDKASTDKLVMENLFGLVFYTTLKIRDKTYKLTVSMLCIALIE